jgi:hypothetical protein
MADEKHNLFQLFLSCTTLEIKEHLVHATDREEILFYQRLLSLKLGLAQEKVVGMELL